MQPSKQASARLSGDSVPVRNVAGGIVGNVIERYDFALFGGTAPLVCAWLIRETANPLAPAYDIVGLGVVSFFATLSLRLPVPTSFDLRA